MFAVTYILVYVMCTKEHTFFFFCNTQQRRPVLFFLCERHQFIRLMYMDKGPLEQIVNETRRVHDKIHTFGHAT